jgi:hypothetical protein
MIKRPHPVRPGDAAGNSEFLPASPGGMGAVARYPTALPVARDGRDKGRKAVSGE